jgi:hypothetical protein
MVKSNHTRNLKAMSSKDIFVIKLKDYSYLLTKQQLKTLRGQAIKGDVEAAKKGLVNILKRLDNPVL